MQTKITKEKVGKPDGSTETFWVLWEISRPNINEPWVAIDDSKNRQELKRYQTRLENGWVN